MKENVEKVKSLILEEFDKISRDLSEEELSAVKRQLTGQHDISMENSQVQLVNLIASEVRSSADDFYDFSVNVDSVSVEDVKEMASKVIDGSYSFFALVPSKNS